MKLKGRVDERWHSRRTGVSRVHHHHVRLGQDLRAHGGEQGAALLQPAGDESAARLLAVLVRDAFGSGIDLGPPEHVIVWIAGWITRQVAQCNQDGEAGLEAKFTTGSPGGE